MRRAIGQDRRPGSTAGSVKGSAAGSGRRIGERPRPGDRRRLRPDILVLEDRRLLAAFTVTDTGNSSSDGSGDSGSLPYCIQQADSNHQANTIRFDPTVFIQPETIKLGGSALILSDTAGTQTIAGPSAGVTINGNGQSGVLQVDSGVTASLSGLTISGGSTIQDGGGLVVAGTLTVNDCTISGNTAQRGGGVYVDSGAIASFDNSTLESNFVDMGGAIYDDGNLTLSACTIAGNNSYYQGSGVVVDNGATASLVNSTLASNYDYATNVPEGYAGYTVEDAGTLTVTGCTISGNSDVGVGVFRNATASLVNSTLADNNGGLNGSAGAIGDYGILTLTGCTISGNNAGNPSGPAGGGLNLGYSGTPATLSDTIVAGNTHGGSPSDIGGGPPLNPSSWVNNLIGDGGSGGIRNGSRGNIVLTNQDVGALKLSTLGDYGGPTETMALLPGSLGIGAGILYPDGYPLEIDQRGLPLDSPAPDIGAFQTNPLIVNTAGDGIGSPPGDLSLRQAVNLANVLGAAESIAFSPSAFATRQTITLTQGQLELSDTAGTQMMTAPAAGLTVDGAGLSRVFQVDAGVMTDFSGLTITGGSAANGAGLEDLGTATLTNCTVIGDSATTGGVIEVAGGGLNLGEDTITSADTAVRIIGGSSASISACTINGGGTAILTGSSSSDFCSVFATEDNFSGETIGVQGVQDIPVDATLDWWGGVGGPNSSGAANAVGSVGDSPWLGDRKSLTLDTPDSLGFASTAGDSYSVDAYTTGPTLTIDLDHNLMGTVVPNGTILFAGSGGTVAIEGQSGTGFNTDAFTITNAAVTFAAADAFKGAAIEFSGAIGRTIAAEGTANTFTVSGWTGTGTLTAPAGTGTVVASKSGGFTLSNASLDSTDGMTLSLAGITTARLTDTGSGHTFTLTGWKGNGTFKGSSETLVDSLSANVTLADASLAVAGLPTLKLSGFTTAELTDTGGGHSFGVTGWRGQGSLTDTAATKDTVTASKSGGFTLSDASLDSTDGMALGLAGITTADLIDTGSGHTFTLTGWTGHGTFKGASETLVDSLSANVTLADASLAVAGLPTVKLSGFTDADLTVTSASAASYTLNATAFTGAASLGLTGAVSGVILGGTGAETLSTTSSGNSILIAKGGKSQLIDTGTGSNILIGAGPGGDPITGNGHDILIGGTTSYDNNLAALDAILAEWDSSDSYSTRISKIMNGIKVGTHTYALGASTVTPTTTANTIGDGSGATQDNWFIAGPSDQVVKKANETETTI